MNRRGFIERIAALAGFSLAAPIVQAATTQQEIELQRSPVAGFQYQQGDRVWSMLTVGAALDLVREPENAFDARAVRVDWQGQKIGYLPRIDNAAVSHLLDSGQRLIARVTSLSESSNPWNRVELAVLLNT
jgi:hypothetical protein